MYIQIILIILCAWAR